MPNHCENNLVVTGSKADLDAFKDAARKDDHPLEIENFIPMPDDVRTSNPPTSRDWALNNWGTKWGAYECEFLEVSDSVLEYIFLTAWSPFNTKVMTTLSTRFPSLQFSLNYQELSIAFKGHISAVAGNITNQWSRDMTEAELTL